MRLRGGWGIVLLIAACQDLSGPTPPCTILCSEEGVCPSNMACGVDGYCHDPEDDMDCHAGPATLPADAAPTPDAAADAGPADAPPCSAGDLNAVSPSNGHCYMFFATATQWSNARTLCQTLGAHLVTLTDGYENSFVRETFVGTREVSIGATDGVAEMNWRWVNDETWAYTSWRSGEPNNTDNEDCAVLQGQLGGLWDDRQCHHAFAYVCERED